MKDEYENLDELKKALRRKQEHPDEKQDIKISREDLFKSVVDLSSQIKELTEIFKLAAEGMKAEDKAYEEVKLKLDSLLKNDQDLAKGLLMVIENQREKEDQYAKLLGAQLQPQSIQPIAPQERAPDLELLSPTLPRMQQARGPNLFNTVYPNLSPTPQPVRMMQEPEPEPEPGSAEPEDENLTPLPLDYTPPPKRFPGQMR